MNKHGNIKVVCDGIKFDSQAEARRYCELKLMQRAGIIKDLELQKLFELIPGYYETYARYGKNGKRLKDGKKCIEKPCVYYADFAYYDNEKQKYVVEDVKGYKGDTAYQLFVIKRKLMLQKYGIRVEEIG